MNFTFSTPSFKPIIMFFFISCLTTMMLSGCALKRDNQFGHQYIDGSFSEVLNPIDKVRSDKPKNFESFEQQRVLAEKNSVRIRKNFGTLYKDIDNWVKAGSDLTKLKQFGISTEQLGGGDKQGNVLFTSYYSPVIELRHKKNDIYRYPLYSLPKCIKNSCPSRQQIYDGALNNKGLELGYSDSLINIFLLEVQGSGFIHYGDANQLNYFAYAGKNNKPYTSIGRILIDQGEIPSDKMSTAMIKEWVSKKDEATVKQLLAQNESYVFFQPTDSKYVRGAAGVPLLPEASVAADRDYFEMGSVILAEVPQLDRQGHWTGQHILKLLIVLDTGGVVKGNQFDIYQGIGEEAGHKAGFYRHFGRVWKLNQTGI